MCLLNEDRIKDLKLDRENFKRELLWLDKWLESYHPDTQAVTLKLILETLRLEYALFRKEQPDLDIADDTGEYIRERLDIKAHYLCCLARVMKLHPDYVPAITDYVVPGLSSVLSITSKASGPQTTKNEIRRTWVEFEPREAFAPVPTFQVLESNHSPAEQGEDPSNQPTKTKIEEGATHRQTSEAYDDAVIQPTTPQEAYTDHEDFHPIQDHGISLKTRPSQQHNQTQPVASSANVQEGSSEQTLNGHNSLPAISTASNLPNSSSPLTQSASSDVTTAESTSLSQQLQYKENGTNHPVDVAHSRKEPHQVSFETSSDSNLSSPSISLPDSSWGEKQAPQTAITTRNATDQPMQQPRFYNIRQIQDELPNHAPTSRIEPPSGKIITHIFHSVTHSLLEQVFLTATGQGDWGGLEQVTEYFIPACAPYLGRIRKTAVKSRKKTSTHHAEYYYDHLVGLKRSNKVPGVIGPEVSATPAATTIVPEATKAAMEKLFQTSQKAAADISYKRIQYNGVNRYGAYRKKVKYKLWLTSSRKDDLRPEKAQYQITLILMKY